MEALLVLFEVVRLLLRLALAYACYHFLRSALLARREPPRPEPIDAALPGELPSVTVQLPMRNEYYVAERAIDAACALDWPRDRLEIQVLDDSDDQSRELVRRIVERHVARGVPLRLITRPAPSGYKAGALNEGLRQSHGELVAIFDADSMPPPDFLRRIVPGFADPRVGAVQGRWEFTNRDESLVARVQSSVLDGMFVVDQHVRSMEGLPLQFNGTSGVWRRRCLEEVGGWNEESITEDLDLSVRAQLAGWRIVHRRDLAVPTELPASMAAFRSQQRRWCNGSAQALRQLAGRVIRSPLSWHARLALLMQLGRHAIYPPILISVLSAPGTTLFGLPYLVDYGAANLLLLAVVLVALLAHHLAAQRYLRQPARRLLHVPLIIPLVVGVSLRYTISLVSGLLFRGGPFVRTPKPGAAVAGGPVYTPPWDPLAIGEVLIGAAYLGCAVLTMLARFRIYGVLFFGVAAGFLWVGLGSLWPGSARGLSDPGSPPPEPPGDGRTGGPAPETPPPGSGASAASESGPGRPGADR